MLTDQQVELIGDLSRAVFLATLLGAACGVFIAGAITLLRGGTAAAFLRGVGRAILGATIAAVALSLIVNTIETAYGTAGKTGHAIGEPVDTLMIFASLMVTTLVAAIAAQSAIPPVPASRTSAPLATWTNAVVWAFSGAVIGALANVGFGFDGYFVVQSNAGPIGSAVGGALVLAIGGFLLQLLIGVLERPATSSKGGVHHRAVSPVAGPGR
ncbi:MAG: hypothetical protein LLG00_06505 [Planctomycetaceae bacterium]|nr:hypothetical protein [Planctomycetaceae bacterium]